MKIESKIMFLSYLIVLFLVAAIAPATATTIIDGTSNFAVSTESEYDHEITLIPGELTFHWNDVNGNTIECRLLHIAPSLDKAPSWLGVGFYDTFANTQPVTADSEVIIGSDAVIGLVANSNVKKYALDGMTVGETDGVHPLDHQTLIDATIKQHDSDDGSVATILTFTKELEESNVEEVRLRKTGVNVFLWGVGAPGETAFVMNDQWGAITLDLEAVKSLAEQGATGGGSDGSSTSDGGGINTVPIVDGECSSNLSGYNRQFDVTSDVTFYWIIDGSVLNAALKVQKDAWVGFGVSKNGMMVGSEGIIGNPAESSASTFLLTDQTLSGVEAATGTGSLQAAAITQDGGYTTLTFEISLDVANDPLTIHSTGLNTFIYAVGKGNEIGYHASRGSFRIDLATCDGGTPTMTQMGAFAAHGTIATLAWAIASPFAMTVAWFRTLVPSSWIYIHVFSNVCSFFFTLIAVIVAISAMSVQQNPSHFNSAHHWVGIVMLVGVTFQVMNGFLRPPVEKRDPYSTSHYDIDNGWIKLPRTPREVWYFSHRLTGISLLGMGIYQISSGLNLFAADFNVSSIAPWFWGYVGIFAFCLIALKFWIMYEEYKARRGMEAMHVEHRSGGSAGGASDDLVPVQFDMS